MRKKLGKWFIVSLMGYLTLAMVVLAMVGIPSYLSMERSSRAQRVDSAEGSLESLTGLMNNLWQQMDYQSNQLVDYTARSLQDDVRNVLKLRSTLKWMVASSGVYSEMAMVYLPELFKSQPLVYSNSVVIGARQYFQYVYHYEDWSVSQIYDFIPGCTAPALRPPESITLFTGEEIRALTYVVPLKRTARNTRGVLLYMIQMKDFARMVALANLPEGSRVVMWDERGRCLWAFDGKGDTVPEESWPAGAGEYLSAEGEAYMAFAPGEKGYNGWSYSLLVPAAFMGEGVRSGTRRLVIYLAVIGLGAVLLALGLAIYSGRPVRRLIRAAQPYRLHGEEDSADLGAVERMITRLGQDNRTLSDALRSQQGAVNNFYLEQLLNGRLEKRPEIGTMLAEHALSPEEGCLRVLAARIDGAESYREKYDAPMRSLIRYGIAQLMERTLEGMGMPGACCDFGQGDHVAALIQCPEPAGEALRQLCEQMNELSVESFHFSLTMGVSRPVRGLEAVAGAYQRALAATEQRYLTGYGQLQPEREESVEAPETAEDAAARLREAFHGGSAEACGEAVDRLCGELMGGGDPLRSRREMRRALMQACRWANERLLLQSGEEGRTMDEIMAREYETLEQARAAVHRVLALAQQSSERVNRAQKSRYVAEAMEYVDRHLENPALTIDSAAEELGVSGSYLSRMFRESGELTFAQYVDLRRMQKACGLLRGTNLKIQDILDACGYGDKANFARKFKRQFGLTPMEYRKREAGTDDAPGVE